MNGEEYKTGSNQGPEVNCCISDIGRAEGRFEPRSSDFKI